MKKMVVFAVKIMCLRFSVLCTSLAQTILWAAVLGTTGFGLISIYVSTQVFAGIVSRLGVDNLVVRYYHIDPNSMKERFLDFLLSFILTSIAAALVGLFIINTLVLRASFSIGSLVFIPLVLLFNISLLLGQIVLAKAKHGLMTFVGSALPVGVSTVLFGGASTLQIFPEENGHMLALGFLGVGYFVSTVAFAIVLRGFLSECIAVRPAGRRFIFYLGADQWRFQGRQFIGAINSNGTTLAVSVIFGPTATGVFALAYRFGSLLTYLAEPARLYVMPLVPKMSKDQISVLYSQMLALCVFLGLSGVLFLLGLYSVVELPFSTEPPFELYAAIIMVGAAIHVFVGPVGEILSMCGKEKSNLISVFLGTCVTVLFVGLSAVFQSVVLIVIGAAASMIVIRLANATALLAFLRNRPI